jgi:hypothetical protein
MSEEVEGAGPATIRGRKAGVLKVPERMEPRLSRVVEVRIAGLGEKSKGLAALGGAQQLSWQSACFPNIPAPALILTAANAKRTPGSYRLFTRRISVYRRQECVRAQAR